MEESLDYAADDFYNILGVSPRATTREIKEAYRAIMKDCHPDLSQDEESTAFAALLNEVYATLVDPDMRATYDAVAGFAAQSVNPFLDASFPRDNVFVDEFTCIGCRNCTNVCPASFAIEDDWGRARVMRQGVDSEEKLQEAIDTCPVSCIHWVTAPQLSLLEAAMAKMERVAVWALMSNNGGGKDVFTEASISWEKRQAAVRQRLQEEQATKSWAKWSWASGFGGWGGSGAAAGANFYAQAQEARRRGGASGASSATSSFDGGSSSGFDSDGGSGYDSGYETDGGGGGAAPGSRERQRVASLAARAARAARQYKAMQEMNMRRSRMLLPASAGEDARGAGE